jgi:very-short-patch-repair endonuclease
MINTTVSFLLDLNRQFYQQFGAAFAATRQRLQPGVSRLLAQIPLDGRWLDIGCGNGELSRELQRRGFVGKYVGLDFSREMLEAAGALPLPPASSPWDGEEGQKATLTSEEEKVNRLPPNRRFRAPNVSPEFHEKLLQVARQMRKEPTEAEKILWQHLRRHQILDLNFRRQHPVERFILDIYCSEIGLVIEVDGPIHQYSQLEDALRTDYLESLGLKVMRFTNEQVLEFTDKTLYSIEKIARELVAENLSASEPFSPPPPYPMGRGSGGEVEHFAYRYTDLSDPTWSSPFPPSSFDVALAFAVLHHLPGSDLRLQTLLRLRRLLPPGAFFYHSEWQFHNSPRLLARVLPWETVGLSSGDVDTGDCLLDWRYALSGQAEQTGLRYVHRFELTELARLAEESGFEIVETFESDGQGGRLGLYQAWRAV